MFNGHMHMDLGRDDKHSGINVPFECDVVIDRVSNKSTDYALRVPVKSEVSFGGRTYTVRDNDIGHIGEGYTFEKAMREFSSPFICDINVASLLDRKGNDQVDHVMYHVEGRRWPL